MAEEPPICPECGIPIAPYSEYTRLLPDGSTVDPGEVGEVEPRGEELGVPMHRFCALSTRGERSER